MCGHLSGCWSGVLPGCLPVCLSHHMSAVWSVPGRMALPGYLATYTCFTGGCSCFVTIECFLFACWSCPQHAAGAALHTPIALLKSSAWSAATLIRSIALRNGNAVSSSSASLCCLPTSSATPAACALQTKAKFWRSFPEEQTVVFQRGYYCLGVWDKAQYGRGGVLHAVQELYGDKPAAALISAVTRMLVWWLQFHGFTNGINDTLLNEVRGLVARGQTHPAASIRR